MMAATTFVMTPLYDRLLRGDHKMPLGLYHFHMVTAKQLCRLHYSDGSVKYVKGLLKDLVDAGYVQEDWTPTRTTRSPYIYMLGQKSLDYLREAGLDMHDSFRASKEVGKSYLHIQHDLGLNDILISAALLKWEAPGYHLESFMHHRELKQNPYYTLWRGDKYGLVPDGFLDLRKVIDDGRQRRVAILLEHDRGTEERKQFQRKIRAYVAYLQAEAYIRQFNVKAVTVCFTTFEGERRREQIRAWTREELHGEARSTAASFLFTAQLCPPDPTHLWLAPCWYTPHMEDKPVMILGE